MTTDTSAVDTSTIMMNGVAAIRTQVTPVMVMAFFPKTAVLNTFPAIQRGQNETITVTFTMGGTQTTLTDTIMIAGKPGTNTHGNGQSNHGNGQGNGQGHKPAPNNHPDPH